MLFRSERQLKKPRNSWKSMCGNKPSKQHPTTHSLVWARISSVSMSRCLPGNWRKKSLLSYLQICMPYLPHSLVSGSVGGFTDFSWAGYAVCVHIHSFIYVHTCLCVYLLHLNSLLKKVWICETPSFGLCTTSLPRASQYQLQCVRLSHYFWKISCVCTSWTQEALVSHKQRKNSTQNLENFHAVWLTPIWHWAHL